MVFNMKKIIRNFIFITTFLIYIFLIFYSFYHSLKNGESSSNDSQKFSNFIKNTFSVFNFNQINNDVFNIIVRKLFGHFGLFLLIGIFGLISYFLIFAKIKLSIIVNLIIGFIVSVLAEILQLFTTGRNYSFTDIIINFLGVLLGTLFALSFIIFLNKKQDY